MINFRALFCIGVVLFLGLSFASAWADDGNPTQNVDGCNTLNTTGATYTLTEDVSSSGTCFNITAENITLDCAGHWINYSILGSEKTYGVYSNKSLTTIKNCNIIDGNWTSSEDERYGIYIEFSSNSTLLSNYISTSNSQAVYLSNLNFSNLTLNTAVSDEVEAFFMYDSFNNELFFNTGISNPSRNVLDKFCRGFFLGGSPNNYLFSNNGSGWGNESYDGNSDGFFIYLSNNCTLINNTGAASRDAIILYSSENCNLINNTGISETGVGIYLHDSSNNNLTNNTGISNRLTSWGTNDGYAIWIGEDSNNNLLTSTTGIAYDGNAIGIGYSSNNTLTKSTAISYNSTSVDYPAILFWQAGNNIISDCINISGSLTDVYSLTFWGEGSVENTFINCSYNSSKEVVEDVGDGSANTLIRKWYYQAYANYSNGTIAEGANISAYNSSGSLQFTELTNSSGWIQRKEIIEYNYTNGVRSYYNNYTIFANKSEALSNATNTINFTITQNKIDDLFTLLLPDTTPPTYSSLSYNSSYANYPTLFSINITDETSLHPNGQYVFSTNNTGEWVNDTPVNFTSTPELIYVIKILNSTAGTSLLYKWYFNDSSGNLNSTPLQILTTVEFPVYNPPSGGGSTTQTKPNYNLNREFYEQGEVFQMGRKNKISFKHQEETHTITLNRFDSSSARITIQSDPITVDLNKGDFKEFDLEGDGEEDILVLYNGILDGDAQIFVQKITGITGDAIDDAVYESTGRIEDSENQVTPSPYDVNPPQEKNVSPPNNEINRIRVIIITFTSIILILVVLGLIGKKETKRKERYIRLFENR